MDMAQNILRYKNCIGNGKRCLCCNRCHEEREIVGSIAGDDTIMCAIRTVDDTYAVMKKIRRIVE